MRFRGVEDELEKADWRGDWINLPSAKQTQHIWFRKRFTVADRPTAAFVYVASYGWHEVHINGKRIGDAEFAPALTRINKRLLYMTYDVTPFLQKGENVLALWHGPGWTLDRSVHAKPAIRAQLNMTSKSAPLRVIATDNTWKAAPSMSENCGSWKWADHGGELLDMRKAQPDWSTLKCSDTTWTDAAATIPSWGKRPLKNMILNSQMIEPDRVIRTLRPVSISKGFDPCEIYFGENFTGKTALNLPPGAAGGSVRIEIDDKSPALKKKPGSSFKQVSILKCNPDGSGVFVNRFNFSAGGYVSIYGLKRPLKANEIAAEMVGNDFERGGQSACSSELLNKIYAADLRTFRANTINGYTHDCPHRERMGYGEVAFATAWGDGLPNYSMGAFYTKYLRDWCDMQETRSGRHEGHIHYVAPNVRGCWGGPMWSSAPVTVGWEVYRKYADKRLLAQIYPTGQKWAEYLARHSKDGMLTPVGKFLGDWSAADGYKEWGKSIASLYFNNCTYALVLDRLHKMATALGRDEDARDYAGQLAALKQKIHEKFFNPEKNMYIEGRQVQMAFALQLDIPPKDVRAAVFANLVKRIETSQPLRIDYGSSGLPVLLPYLAGDARFADLVCTWLLSEEIPSYGYFIKNGETTWPEYWGSTSGLNDSRIHTCYTGIAGWYIKALGGIVDDPQQPGMQHFFIKPQVPTALTYANTQSPTPYGIIVSNWRKADGKFMLDVIVPPNSTASVWVPAEDAGSVTESGKPAGQADGVRLERMDGDAAVFSVTSGTYRFNSTRR